MGTRVVDRRRFLWLGALAAGAGVLVVATRGGGEADGGDETVSYGDDPTQVAALTVPPGSGPFGVVVLIHGGFWRAGFDRSLMDGLATDLVERGYATWNLDYRSSADAGWPGTFTDVADGIDALAGAAARHPLDFARVVAVGHSAGGHLACWAATRPGLPEDAPGASPRVELRAAVAQAGVLDLAGCAADGLGGGACTALMGASPDEEPERYQLGSPFERLPVGVPQLLVHGTADAIVPVQVSRRYAAAATEAGDDVELVELDGADHFVLIEPASEAWAAVTSRLDRLLG